jgi:hypothetical protein
VFDFSVNAGVASWVGAPDCARHLYAAAADNASAYKHLQPLRLLAGMPRGQAFVAAGLIHQTVHAKLRRLIADADEAVAAAENELAGEFGLSALSLRLNVGTCADALTAVRHEIGQASLALDGRDAKLAAVLSGTESTAGTCCNADKYWRGRVGMYVAGAKKRARLARDPAPEPVAAACDRLHDYAWKGTDEAEIEYAIKLYCQLIK